MLTSTHKENRVAWARHHLNDNWKKTIFTDETAFQLFSNTIKCWYKNTRPVCLMPKDRHKIFAWGGFCIEGKTSLFCFRGIMDSKLYVEIVERHLPEVNRMLGEKWRFQQDNDPNILVTWLRIFLRKMSQKSWIGLLTVLTLTPLKTSGQLSKERQKGACLKISINWRGLWWNLVDSMKRRCEEVIEKNGERISY